MNKKVFMTDQVYGHLTVIEESGKKVTAVCKCGTVGDYWRNNVLAGYTQSCGCLRNTRVRDACVTHGHKSFGETSKTYRAWRSMKARCDNPAKDSFHRYGGRGISYCDSWRYFENFLRDMGECPAGLELDRRDNNADYSPENCRWITHKENCNNKGEPNGA